MATPLIRPLAWEPPYAVKAALKKKKKKIEGQEVRDAEAGQTRQGLVGYCEDFVMNLVCGKG